MVEKNLEKLFGIDKDALEKSKDILPVLNLGEHPLGYSCTIIFQEDSPREIDTPNSEFSKTARVINIKDVSIDEQGINFSMFLSSKSLAMGIAKLYQANNNSLKDVKARITKSEAVYKKYGKNTCYIVQQII